MHNLRQFLSILRKEKEVVDVYEEVDPVLEIAEIHRRVAATEGPVIFFHKVKNSSFPVVTNLFGSRKRIDLAFANRPDQIIHDLTKLLKEDLPPSFLTLWKNKHLFSPLLKMGVKKNPKGPILEKKINPPDLNQLPLLTCWPQDGGPFITLPLVYTEPIQGGAANLGMYRVQRYDNRTCGLHFQIAKGGGFHFHQAELQNQKFPVSIFIGGPPALILSAILPLPENVPELLMASLLQGEKLRLTKNTTHPHPLISECEFAITGYADPHQRRPEGPFGDHYGYYSWKHDFPFLNVESIYHRKDAIYPATVVGKPKQEDYYIGEYLQELLSPLFPLVMPAVKALWSYGEAGFHSLTSAIVKERFYKESMHSAFRILGEGQLALTKFLLLTDQLIDIKNFKEVLTTILERFQPETDLFIFPNLSLDTLDYTGPSLNKGSRGILLGMGDKKRDLPHVMLGSLPSYIENAKVFVPGCLVIESKGFNDFQQILKDPFFKKWPLIILVDSAEKSCRSTLSFLWTVFTRFDPASDLFANIQTVKHHHLCYELPILIDARMKPRYPPEVLSDDKTKTLVTERWSKYFPQGLEMGSSDEAHVV